MDRANDAARRLACQATPEACPVQWLMPRDAAMTPASIRGADLDFAAMSTLVARSAVVALGLLAIACSPGSNDAPTPIEPGSAASPREVNLITRDYAFVPDSLELVPGETIVLHVVNAGLVVHEAVIGDASVQDAWEDAEAAVVGAPPGPTPLVSVPPAASGIRVVVRSGERVDVTIAVPADVDAGPVWLVGCHISGHLAKGMQVPVRWVEPGVVPGSEGSAQPAP